jgi:outer membrane translocation and assembly module TamA
VNLTINVERGPQFTLGKLTIEGLDVISEPAIRKMWKIESGQPFQDGYPEAFLNRVRDEGVFDNLGKTRAETNIDEATHTVDVTLFFSGARTPAQGKDGRPR